MTHQWYKFVAAILRAQNIMCLSGFDLALQIPAQDNNGTMMKQCIRSGIIILLACNLLIDWQLENKCQALKKHARLSILDRQHLLLMQAAYAGIPSTSWQDEQCMHISHEYSRR